MGYWSDGDLILGDTPANAITAAWRRILVPRSADRRRPPLLCDALAAFTASMQRASCWPPVASLVVRRGDGVPVVEVRGAALDLEAASTAGTVLPESPLDLELTSSFDAAMLDIDRAYGEEFGRRATTEEIVATLDFVVRPEPRTFFADAETMLAGTWDLHATIARGPVRCDAGIVLVGVTAAEAMRILIDDAGGRVLERATHDVPNRAIDLAEQLHDLQPRAEAWTIVETATITEGATPNVYLLRRGTIPARGVAEQARALSDRLGTWTVALDATAAVGELSAALLGHALGRERSEANLWRDLDALSDRLGAVVSSPWSGFGCARVETLFLPTPPPRVAAAPRSLHLGVISAPRATVRRVLRERGASTSAPLLERPSDLHGAELPITIVRGDIEHGDFDDAAWLAAAQVLDRLALTFTVSADGVTRWTARDFGDGMRSGTASGPAEVVAVCDGLMIMTGDPPGMIRWPAGLRGHTSVDDDPPGLFAPLVQDGVVSIEAIDALVEALPPTWIHGEPGIERLDSSRWPCHRDATLASIAARALVDPSGTLAEIATALERARGNLSGLRQLRDRMALWFDDARLDDDADVSLAQAAHDLAIAHVAAHEGLEAYHVHRRLPGFGATAAATGVRLALERGALDVLRLVEAALACVPAPLEPPRWFWDLLDESAGDRQRLRARLHDCDRGRLVEFHAIHRDLATSLTSAAHLARLPAGTSDTTAFETAAWVVTFGRDRYRATVHDPAIMPTTERPGTASARAMIGVAAEVWAERYGDEWFPTDHALDWASAQHH
jgi:hypothetical protein